MEYLLFHYKINCIVEQLLKELGTFWNKCIKKFNGQKRNMDTLNNRSSSFVISKCRISNHDLCEMLEIGNEIESSFHIISEKKFFNDIVYAFSQIITPQQRK